MMIVPISVSAVFCDFSVYVFSMKGKDWLDGSVGKGACCEAWQPEFDPQLPYDGKRTDSHGSTPSFPHVHIHISPHSTHNK